MSTLIERLRSFADGFEDAITKEDTATMREAADRIESLEAENARLIERDVAAMTLITLRTTDLCSVAVERDALKAALAFAASVIKSGEPWSAECDRLIGAALQPREKDA